MVQNLTRCKIFNSKTDTLKNFFSGICVFFSFKGFDRMIISTFNVKTNLL